MHYSNSGTSKLHSEMLRLEKKTSQIGEVGQDEIVMHTVNRFGGFNGVKSCQLEWNIALQCWAVPKEFVLDPYFHPCLSQENVFGHLSEIYSRNPGSRMKVWLMQQVRVNPPTTPPNSEPWYIRCDRKFKHGSRLARREHSYSSAYSCVTVRSRDGSQQGTLARVLAILKVKISGVSGQEVESVSKSLCLL